MNTRFSRIFILVLVGLALLIWSQVIYADPKSSDGLEIHFLDVGQGDSALAVLPNGDQLLIDGGPDSAVLQELGQYMPVFDRRIEYVVLTHPHADHLAGLIEVAQRYEVGEVLETDADGESAMWRRWEDLLREKGTPVYHPRQNQVFDWGDGVTFEVLWPSVSWAEYETQTWHDKFNDFSIVGRLRFHDQEVMLTGDAEDDVQNKLCELGAARLASDILKVAHHGSSNGLASCFLEAVAPRWAVISVGKDNKFGHPAASTLDLLKAKVASVLRTDEDGTVSFVLSDNGIVRKW